MFLNHSNSTYHIVDLETDPIPATLIWCGVVRTLSYDNDGQLITPTEPPKKFRPNDLSKLKAFLDTESLKPNTYFVGHNIISFDVPVLARILDCHIPRNRILDTLTLSYLYHPHIPGGHSLRAWGERLGEAKTSFDDFSQFSEEQLEYCVQDTNVTAILFRRLTSRMRKAGFSELSCEIEHKIRAIIDGQQINGVYFDVKGAQILRADLEDKLIKLESQIFEVFPPQLKVVKTYNLRYKADGTPFASFIRHKETYPKITVNEGRTKYATWDWHHFNIGSPKQRVERLEAVGWEAAEFTPKGSPKATEDSLVAFAESSGTPEVAFIAEWMTLNDRIKSLTEWLAHTNPNTSRIHGTVFSCGAGTRRMRHQKPNTANICGLDKPYGEQMRDKWTVPDGKVLVGIDAKGLEGRVLLHYLNNPAANKVFLEGDVHQMNADAVTALVGFEVSRRTAKTLYYAFLYGAGNPKLGKILGHNRKVGALVRKAIMKNVPGLAELTESIEAEFIDNYGRLETIDGGFVVCPATNAALNYKCQSAGAILMKLASIYMDEEVDHSRAIKVLDVHDEVQWETAPEYAEELGQLYCDCIKRAGVTLGFRMEMDGDYNVGTNWAETH